jgi:hypothetical protein
MAMQKKENILGEAEGAVGGGALGPGVAPVTLGLFLLPGGRPGRRFTEAPMTILRRPELFYFCFHEGGPDPAVPPESQGSDENLLRQPCGKVGRLEILDEKRRRCGGGGI